MEGTIDLPYEDGAFRWPEGTPLPEGVHDGERRFDIETQKGGWQRIVRVRGLAVEVTKRDQFGHFMGYRIHGDRNLLKPTESGYQMEGRVSVGGKKRRAFTGSMMVRYKDPETGKDRLVNFAVLHVASEKTTA
jgi:hypothetical protein